MAKKTYHVTPHASGWQVKAEGASRASAVRPTKEEAVKLGRDMARNAESSLLIHKENGQLQTEHTYGKDPYPPKG